MSNSGKVFIGIIVAIGLLIGGYMMVEKITMISEVKENKDKIEQYVKMGTKKGSITAINIEYDKSSQNPMGGINVSGYINENKEMSFGVHLNKDNDTSSDTYNEIVVDGGSSSTEFQKATE